MTHTPYRRCAACGTRRPQGELLRLFRASDGAVALTVGRRTGRGVYCCPHEACRSKTLGKSLYAKKLGAAKVVDEKLLRGQMQNLAAELEQRNGAVRHGENHR